MIARTKVIKRVSYYLTSKEIEKIYSSLNKMNLSPAKFAETKGVNKSSFSRIMTGEYPMTKYMYEKAFKHFECLDLPSNFTAELND